MRNKLILAATLLVANYAVAQSGAPWQIGPFTRPESGNPVIAPKPDSTLKIRWRRRAFTGRRCIPSTRRHCARWQRSSCFIARKTTQARWRLAGTPRGWAWRRATTAFTSRAGRAGVFPAKDAQQAREWPGGVEDPRIVEREDGTYVLTYTQWNRKTYSVGIATSRDLKHWTKHGPAFFDAEGGKYAQLKYKSAGMVTRLDPEQRAAHRREDQREVLDVLGRRRDSSGHLNRSDSLDTRRRCAGQSD
jgi:hypothetical protein